MSIEGYEPIVLPGFGGEVTLNDRGDLPQGVASLAKNLELLPGAMRTRRGMDLYGGAPGNWPVRDFAFAYFPDGTQYSFYTEDVLGTLSALVRAAAPGLGTTYVTASYFSGSRVCFKTYNRLTFAAIRMGFNADAPPVKFSIAGNLASTSKGLVLSRMSTQPPQANAAYATSATAGNVSVGDHYFLVIFENATGHRTCSMAQPVKLTVATASRKVDVSALPLGAVGNSDGVTFTKDVVKRLIFATSANPALGPDQYPLTGYYCLETAASGMVVGDNSSTTAAIDFQDSVLVNGTPYTLYADNTAPPPCRGITVYNQRTILWGVRNALIPAGLSQLETSGQQPAQGTFNTPLSFDSGPYTTAPPAGWTAVTGSGGAQTQLAGWTSAPGTPWIMSGNGVTLAPGKIRTNGDLFLGLVKGKEYRIRFFVTNGNTPSISPGTLDLHVTGSSVTVSVTAAQIAANVNGYFDFKIIDASDVLSAGAFLNVGLNNTPANTSQIFLSDIMIYPSDTPLYRNTPWVSKAGQPEAFSNLTGFLGIQDADNSQDVQACFVLRSGVFMAREVSVFGSQDNGGEPATWPISKASDEFGACGPNAVALIDDTGNPGQGTYGIGGSAGMALMVCRNGIALFDGATATPISHEIEPTLARVNWAVAHLVWAGADAARKKVFIGLPVDGSTVINFGLVVDFQDGWGNPTDSPGTGRKWAEWVIGAQNGLGDFAILDPADSRVVFCSTQVPGTGSAAIVKWPSSTPNFFDYSLAGSLNIASKYVTAALPSGGVGEQNFGGVIANVSGVGNLVLNAVLPDNSLLALPRSGTPRVLSAPALHDTYIKDATTSERISIQVQNGSNAGDYFSMNQLTVLAKKSPFTPVRGM